MLDHRVAHVLLLCTLLQTICSQSPEPAAPSFDCPTAGAFPDPNDCHSFYLCDVDLVARRRTCMNGAGTFDPIDKMCVNSSCSRPANSTNSSRFQCPGEGLFADPDTCQYFYRCDKELNPKLWKCNDRIFDPIIRECSFLSCTELAASEPSGRIQFLAMFKCTSAGYYPDPSDCRSFFYCDKRMHAYHSSCAVNEYFDPVNVCASGPCPHSITATTSATTIAEFKCEELGVFEDVNDCTSYYVCLHNRNSEHHTCIQGHFNLSSLQCSEGPCENTSAAEAAATLTSETPATKTLTSTAETSAATSKSATTAPPPAAATPKISTSATTTAVATTPTSTTSPPATTEISLQTSTSTAAAATSKSAITLSATTAAQTSTLPTAAAATSATSESAATPTATSPTIAAATSTLATTLLSATSAQTSTSLRAASTSATTTKSATLSAGAIETVTTTAAATSTATTLLPATSLFETTAAATSTTATSTRDVTAGNSQIALPSTTLFLSTQTQIMPAHPTTSPSQTIQFTGATPHILTQTKNVMPSITNPKATTVSQGLESKIIPFRKHQPTINTIVTNELSPPAILTATALSENFPDSNRALRTRKSCILNMTTISAEIKTKNTTLLTLPITSNAIDPVRTSPCKTQKRKRCHNPPARPLSKTPKSTFPDERFKCPGLGKYPNPRDTTSYFVCGSTMVPFRKQCLVFYVYDPTKKSCIFRLW
ncbi:hypothetical protein Cfor_06728 [Coptotermes formosanus]|uniref:Chitin-binding type-2 domain-containing protein n=1 Tax=Coptotermes formosanus TaxID=36987 RepID=A0A6L2PV36_COPFO|nr:hypothetical protein Cfor_06728 [Coptotermes formosanus]